MNPIKAIIAATIALLTLLPLAGAQASYQADPAPLPSIQPIKPYELKWILGPGQSAAETPFYNGYPTVDHDDPSYPPRRP
jgi:hypothetical protein